MNEDLRKVLESEVPSKIKSDCFSLFKTVVHDRLDDLITFPRFIPPTLSKYRINLRQAPQDLFFIIYSIDNCRVMIYRTRKVLFFIYWQAS